MPSKSALGLLLTMSFKLGWQMPENRKTEEPALKHDAREFQWPVSCLESPCCLRQWPAWRGPVRRAAQLLWWDSNVTPPILASCQAYSGTCSTQCSSVKWTALLEVSWPTPAQPSGRDPRCTQGTHCCPCHLRQQLLSL